MKTLITGTAGFIGYHTAQKLLADGFEVVGLDIINDYYDVNLKYARLAQTGIARDQISYGKPVQSSKHKNYTFYQLQLEDTEAISRLFEEHRFDYVVHLAAQAGVRYSLENPHTYIDSNIKGFLNMLEACRHHPVKHMVYASTSSVYGANTQMPFSEHHHTDHPISLYAATKKANEMMAHSYSQLFHIPLTGLRFFTVYGPWGRPDMALFLFTKAIMEDKPIKVFNNGDMQRDFTYVSDIVEGITRSLVNPPAYNPEFDNSHPDPAASYAPYRIFNIGNSRPVLLLDFIDALEKALGKKAIRHMMPMQPGDVAATWADVSELQNHTGYQPKVGVEEGIERFGEWYRGYYGV
ncbi:MAG: NAD-dependent epimerase [Bacteroidales bacterium]